MFVESTTLQWTEIIVVGVVGTISVPFIMYFLTQNSNRKTEISNAFASLNKQVSIDRAAAVEQIDKVRLDMVRLETTVNLKKETVDKVQTEQNQAGTRLALVEASVTTIKESQARSEQNWQKVSDKLEVLASIKEKVESLADDVSELRQSQNKN